MPNDYQLTTHIRDANLFTRRTIVVAIVMIILVGLLISRLVYLQVVERKRYTTMSRDNQLNLIPVAPNRGLIYDRNGVLLAENIPVYTLDIMPDHVKNIDQTIKHLQNIINVTPEEIEEFHKSLKQHRRYEPVPLKMKLTQEQVAKFYLNQYLFPGVIISARLMRYYSLGKAMANVLGFVGRINEQDLEHIDKTNYSASNYIGKVGIEKYYEKQLHGKVGYDEVEMDASGRIVRTIKRIKPIPGNDLHLSIDSKLQITAEKALGDHRGAVVAIDPQTGEVLALVSNPSYNPNLFVQGITPEQYQELQNSPGKPLYNRAIRGQYPLASTIKPYMALQGLDSGAITPGYKIYCPGWFKLPHSRRIYRDWKKHSWVNLRKAIIVSCDTYFYSLSIKIGIKGIDKILSSFGFGKYTHIDMEEEMPGLTPSPAWKMRRTGEPWYTGDTVNSSIGQGFMLATPLQLADGVAGIAMDGKRFQPKLLHSFKKPDGTLVVQQPIPETPIKLQDTSAWYFVIADMEAVITSTSPSGTGYRFGRNPPYTVAAKTGTGQVYKPRQLKSLPTAKLPEKYRAHSLFIAFAPVDDPKIAVAIVVEHTPGFAPAIARKVMDEYLMTEQRG